MISVVAGSGFGAGSGSSFFSAIVGAATVLLLLKGAEDVFEGAEDFAL